jgi:hypothetical protein
MKGSDMIVLDKEELTGVTINPITLDRSWKSLGS